MRPKQIIQLYLIVDIVPFSILCLPFVLCLLLAALPTIIPLTLIYTFIIFSIAFKKDNWKVTSDEIDDFEFNISEESLEFLVPLWLCVQVVSGLMYLIFLLGGNIPLFYPVWNYAVDIQEVMLKLIS